MTGRVRQATEADIPEMMALRLSVRENELFDPSQVTAEDCRRYVAGGNMWVWDEGGAILGIPPARSTPDGSGRCSSGPAMRGTVLARPCSPPPATR